MRRMAEGAKLVLVDEVFGKRDRISDGRGKCELREP